MICSTLDLCEKDVINVCTGRNLGKITELELDTECGRILSFSVGRDGFGSLFSAKKKVRVPWGCIVKIGPDTIIVNVAEPPSEKHEGCLKEKCR